jgi:hypothetical protein
MSGVLLKLSTTVADTAVPMAGPAKALTVGRSASSETSWRGTYVSPHSQSAAG